MAQSIKAERIAVADSTPEAFAQALRHFGFKPEPKEIREDFTQWRKDVGHPLEMYVDVYKSKKLKLYSRTGITSFPQGKRPNFLTTHFDGAVQTKLDLARLLMQVEFIKKPEFEKVKGLF